MKEKVPQAEREIAAHMASAAHELALTATLQEYGSEILGFLMARLRSRQHADEVFSVFAEDLWRSLPGMTLRTTMRAYAYALAHHALHRFLQRDLRKQRAAIPLSEAPAVAAIVAKMRTETAPYLVTENKSRIAALRERLTSDEQALLTLRVDRGLGWREIAEVFAEDDDLVRAAAQKRKRFQLIKEKLTRWAREEGLLDDLGAD